MKLHFTKKEVSQLLDACRNGIQLERDTLRDASWDEESRKDFKRYLKLWIKIRKKLNKAKRVKK